MKTNDPLEGRRVRLALLLWLAGMIGAVAITVAVIPRLAELHALPMPVSVLMVASLCQSALLIGLAVWAGTSLSPAVGLHAAIFEAAVTSRPLSPAFRAQVWSGLLAGAVAGGLLLAFSSYAPAPIAAVQGRFNLPLLARILYGGITEELLLRWGVMTTLLWLTWRFIHRRRGVPGAGSVWIAIATSALLFGLGHLPAAAALIGHLSAGVIFFIVGANAMFGVLFGYLFWRFGLEAAMIAHGTAHAVSYLFAQL